MLIRNGVSDNPCDHCGCEVDEFDVPPAVWNAVVRFGGPKKEREHLCIWCFAELAVRFIQQMLNGGKS